MWNKKKQREWEGRKGMKKNNGGVEWEWKIDKGIERKQKKVNGNNKGIIGEQKNKGNKEENERKKETRKKEMMKKGRWKRNKINKNKDGWWRRNENKESRGRNSQRLRKVQGQNP